MKKTYVEAEWPEKPTRSEPLPVAAQRFGRKLVDQEGEAAVLARSGLSDYVFARGLAGLGLYRSGRVAWIYFLEREGYEP